MNGFVQAVTAKTQCAGQRCEERKTCLRYRRRERAAEWASFDLELVAQGGPCVHRIKLKR